MKSFALLIFSVLTSNITIGQQWPLESSTWYMNGITSFQEHPLSYVSIYNVSYDTSFQNYQCKVITQDSMPEKLIICDSGTSELFLFHKAKLYSLFDYSKSDGDTVIHPLRIYFTDDQNEFQDTMVLISSKIFDVVQLSDGDTLYEYQRLYPIDQEFWIDSSLYSFTYGNQYFNFKKFVGFLDSWHFAYPIEGLYLPSGYNPPFLRCYYDSSFEWKHHYFQSFEIGDCEYEAPPNIVTDIVKKSDFKIWPNPVTDILYISESATPVKYEIFNTNGQLIYSEFDTSKSISIESLLPGMYILQVISSNKIYTTKFIKQ